ncbi:unnamed protein product [Ectocarpus sp. CCAP 1310/34]|nr:unnamed protein product [Ectocarpus sp. CCAP 1310/34]
MIRSQSGIVLNRTESCYSISKCFSTVGDDSSFWDTFSRPYTVGTHESFCLAMFRVHPQIS